MATADNTFDRAFDKFWLALEQKIDSTPELRGLLHDTMRESGVLNGKIVFVTVGGKPKQSNYYRYTKFRLAEMRPLVNGAVEENAPPLKECRSLISTEWKAKTVEDKAKWSKDDGTGEYVPKTSKRHSNGYNLFTRFMSKEFSGSQMPAGERFTKTSEAWKALTAEEREKWNADARQNVLDNGGTISTKPKHPKKLSGYNLYIRETSVVMKEAGQTVSLPGISAQWKELTEEAKASWNAKALASHNVSS